MQYIDSIISGKGRIYIISGEGEYGSTEPYNGARTRRALSMRLTKERCGGDRWARATIETLDPKMVDGHAVVFDGQEAIDQTLIPGAWG